MKECRITVFTPTYNRAYIISNVFESLKRQSFLNFEWLVVDDGSTDNTYDLIDSFIKENPPFEIKYFKKENGGQHTALNLAIGEARGDVLMIVDSDDYLSDNALERVVYWLNSIDFNDSKYAGVVGLQGYISGGVIGDKWKCQSNYLDANMFERKKYGLLGDKAEVFFVSVLRKFYPIPVFENENDVQKGLLWNRISNAGYIMRYFNEIIYYAEYLSDGMTKNIYKNWLRNFNGYTLWMKEYTHSNVSWIRRFKNICMYNLLGSKKGLSISSCKEKLDVTLFETLIARCVVKIYHQGIARSKYRL